MTKIIRIREWSKYQHYKHRNPPWIKLHREMITKRLWVKADNASRVLAIACMMLAAGMQNAIPFDPEYIQQVAYLNEIPDFSFLVSVGFIEIVELSDEIFENEDKNASEVLAPRKQPASNLHQKYATETETETETEKAGIKNRKDQKQNHKEPPYALSSQDISPREFFEKNSANPENTSSISEKSPISSSQEAPGRIAELSMTPSTPETLKSDASEVVRLFQELHRTTVGLDTWSCLQGIAFIELKEGKSIPETAKIFYRALKTYHHDVEPRFRKPLKDFFGSGDWREFVPQEKPAEPAAPVEEIPQAQPRTPAVDEYLTQHIDPWSEIQGYLKPEINAHSFDTWLRPLKFIDVSGEIVRVKIPTPEFRHVSDKYGPAIQQAMTSLEMPFRGVEFI